MPCFRIGLVALLLATASAGPVLSQSRCAVTDPTGTPLNIRERPNGGIVGRVGNGAIVRVVQRGYDERGRAWVLIRPSDSEEIAGWVYREFVSCY